jgi:hypothetical protein
MSDPDERRLEDDVRSALADAFRGTDYLPDAGAIITDVVVVAGMVDSDGDFGRVLFCAGAPWSCRGLAGWGVDVIDAAEERTLDRDEDE